MDLVVQIEMPAWNVGRVAFVDTLRSGKSEHASSCANSFRARAWAVRLRRLPAGVLFRDPFIRILRREFNVRRPRQCPGAALMESGFIAYVMRDGRYARESDAYTSLRAAFSSSPPLWWDWAGDLEPCFFDY